MSDLPEKLRRHYEAQSLPSARVDAILAAGQRAAREHTTAPHRRTWRSGLWGFGLGLATAAAAVLAFVFFKPAALTPIAPPAGVAHTVLQDELRAFFARPDCQLAKSSRDPREIRAWLLAQGAPAGFEIPAPLAGLVGFGGHVLSLEGRPAFLLCLWLHPPDGDAPAGGMMKKPAMSATPDAPAGPTMQKPPMLVHLIVTPRGTLLDAQPPAAPARFIEERPWTFAHWSQPEVSYTVAASVPAETLRALLEPNPTALAPAAFPLVASVISSF